MKTTRVKLSDDKDAMRTVSTCPETENKRSRGQDVPGVVMCSVLKDLLKEKEECVSNMHTQEVLENRCFWD